MANADQIRGGLVAEAGLARGEGLLDLPPSYALDETRKFLGRFIATRSTQLDVLTVWPVHTWLLDPDPEKSCFVVTPRLLITSVDPECGKTETLRRELDLSRNGWAGGKGTRYAVRAKLSEPERVTIGVDEASDVFGRHGRGGTTHPLGTLLREGYKIGATDSFASAMVAEDVDVFVAAVIAGRGAAVPADIRSRAVRVILSRGEPAEDYLVREHDPEARMLRDSLGQWARANSGQIRAFRARGLHPKLTGRKREIWEPLFAIAAAAGGTWPRRILAAFVDLALDEPGEPKLTPAQATLRDVLRSAELVGGDRVAGADIIAEMRRLGCPVYDSKPDRSLAMMIAEAMNPVRPAQFRLPGGGPVVRGYALADIRQVAAARLPAAGHEDAADQGTAEDDSVTLFDVTDGEGVTADEEVATCLAS